MQYLRFMIIDHCHFKTRLLFNFFLQKSYKLFRSFGDSFRGKIRRFWTSVSWFWSLQSFHWFFPLSRFLCIFFFASCWSVGGVWGWAWWLVGVGRSLRACWNENSNTHSSFGVSSETSSNYLFIFFLFRYNIKCVCDGVNITHAEAIWILGTFRTSIIVNN